MGGRLVKYPVPTPLANLNLSLLDKLGVPTSRASATAPEDSST